MIFWAIIIIILDALLYTYLISGNCSQNCWLFFCVGIAVAALGILFRTFVKMRAGRFEQLQEELNDTRQENDELMERISNLREQQIMSRTDKDLV